MTDGEFGELLFKLTELSYDCGAFIFEYGTPEEQNRYEKLLSEFNETKTKVLTAFSEKGKSNEHI
jgi:hypothetical protein